MTRSAIKGLQKTSASVVPELDFDIVSQATVDGSDWLMNPALTPTIISYSQFQSETGFDGKHPLEHLGQTNVLKIVVDAATAGTPDINKSSFAVAEIDLTHSFVGGFVYLSEDATTEIGSNLIRMFVEDGGLSNYIQVRMSTKDTDHQDTWQLLSGIDEEFSAVGNDFYTNKVGSPDMSAIDRLYLTLHSNTNTNAFTFYLTSIFSGAKRRPTFCLEQDDLTTTTDQWIADLDTYGFKGAMNAVASNVSGAVVSEAELKSYLDAGHFVCSHGGRGHVDGNDGGGVVVGWTDDDAIAQIDSELAFFRAFYPSVLDDTTLLHQALPLGQQTDAVRKYMRELGFKTVRRTGGSNPENGGALSTLICQPEYADGADYLHLPACSFDNWTSVEAIAFIDILIKHSLDCVIYIHGYTGTPTRGTYQAILAHFRKRVNQGLCEVMPRHLWYEKSIAQYGKRSA